jgi:hypothetical protein
MADSATTTSTDQTHPHSEGGRELARVLALLEAPGAWERSISTRVSTQTTI